jgi:hypothetical protein
MSFGEIKDSRLLFGAPETVESDTSDFGLKTLVENQFDNLDTPVRKVPRTFDPKLLLLFDSETAFPFVVADKIRFVAEDYYVVIADFIEI